jgi:hypothetical protein
MRAMLQEKQEVFPDYGSRARVLKRFERDLARWLATAEGRFAEWDARRAVSGGAGATEPADHDLGVVGREAR